MNIHFSVDDIFGSFMYLKKTNAKTIYDSFVFKTLRELHDEFAITISAYCLYSIEGRCLTEIPDQWKTELQMVENWLSFGFHGLHENSNYNNQSGSQIKEDYQKLEKEIKRITSHTQLSRIIRLHYFSGNKEVIRALKECGVAGLLAADDDRISYGLDRAVNAELRMNGCLHDRETEMDFFRTDFRVENIDEDGVSPLIQEIKAQNRVVFFTHEHYLGNERVVKNIKEILRKIM